MAKKLRTEGDYTFWSDGSQRYAKGNSQGKQAGTYHTRPPQAARQWDTQGEGLAKAKADNEQAQLSTAIKREERRKLSLNALGEALVLHPASHKQQDGLRMLWEARIEQASGADGPAVKAHEMVEEVWSGKQATPPAVQQAGDTKILISISPGVEADQRRLTAALMDEVIEGEVVESASQPAEEDGEEAQGG
jgi:hypothetical protein